jgi:hypothetical protein
MIENQRWAAFEAPRKSQAAEYLLWLLGAVGRTASTWA